MRTASALVFSYNRQCLLLSFCHHPEVLLSSFLFSALVFSSFSHSSPFIGSLLSQALPDSLSLCLHPPTPLTPKHPPNLRVVDGLESASHATLPKCFLTVICFYPSLLLFVCVTLNHSLSCSSFSFSLTPLPLFLLCFSNSLSPSVNGRSSHYLSILRCMRVRVLFFVCNH